MILGTRILPPYTLSGTCIGIKDTSYLILSVECYEAHHSMVYTLADTGFLKKHKGTPRAPIRTTIHLPSGNTLERTMYNAVHRCSIVV